MTELKWIKVAINVFDNRKIKQLECMPKGDTYIVLWFKLLCLAGGCNDGGLVYLTKKIPYTVEMLASQLNKPVAFVKTALDIFQDFGMIEVNNNYIQLTGWEKYQSIDKLAEIKEQNRIRKQAQRERDKKRDGHEDGSCDSSVLERDVSRDSHVTVTEEVTQRHAIDKEERNKNKDIDIDKEKDNTNVLSKKKPTRHAYGRYKNVLLSDEDMDELQKEFPFDWRERIERVSEYVASKGQHYKDYLATIRRWAKNDIESKGKRGNTQDLRDVAEEVQAMLDVREEDYC